MNVNIYLPDDLGERVKEAGLEVSRICQEALSMAAADWEAKRAKSKGGPVLTKHNPASWQWDWRCPVCGGEVSHSISMHQGVRGWKDAMEKTNAQWQRWDPTNHSTQCRAAAKKRGGKS